MKSHHLNGMGVAEEVASCLNEGEGGSNGGGGSEFLDGISGRLLLLSRADSGIGIGG